MNPSLRLAIAAVAIASFPAVSQADHLTTQVCGGTVTVNNHCEGQELFIRICLGLDGVDGKRALKVQAGKSAAPFSVPFDTSWSWTCGSAPADVCPGDLPVDVTTCESDFDDGVFLDVIQTMLAEANNVQRYQPAMETKAQCLFDALEALTPAEKGGLLDAAIKPVGAERAEAVGAWYTKVFTANPTMAEAGAAC